MTRILVRHGLVPEWAPRRAGAQRRPWPLEDLLSAAGIGTDELMPKVGISGRDRQYAVKWGCTDRQADRWSCRLGLHPGTVWVHWFDYERERAVLEARVAESRSARRRRIAAWRPSGLAVAA